MAGANRPAPASRRALVLLGMVAVAAGVLPTLDEPKPRSASEGPPARSEPSATPSGRRAETLPRAPCGAAGARRTLSFRVEVDRAAPIAAEEFAREVRATLCDGRSWIASRAVRFRYDPRGPLLIGLRTAAETQRRCALIVRQNVHRTFSCGASSEIAINLERWFGGAPGFPGPLVDYRRMLVNHEVGHALGLGHAECPADGARAPVMMQQSKGLTSKGRTCRPNPWPLPSELSLAR